MAKNLKAEIEVDEGRGVLWVHLVDPKDVEKLGIVTVIRICGLPLPLKLDEMIDITYSLQNRSVNSGEEHPE